jgi:ADP-heptose:LPS heptosyltransferase
MFSRIEGIDKILIFRALQLGDMLCAAPALRAIRAHFPRSGLVLVGLPWAAAFVARFGHLLDGFRSFPGHPGLPEQEPDLSAWTDFLDAIRGERFDLAINLHGAGSITNPIVESFGARRCAGFVPSGAPRPDPALFLTYPDRGSEVHRLLRLAEHLGCAALGEQLEFPLDVEDRIALREALGTEARVLGPLVVVHPGASVPERRWPVERFAAVADGLAATGLRVVLTGTGGERGLTSAVADAMRYTPTDLAGRTSLGSVGALIESAALLICNDTGVSHVAAALRTPSVVLSTGENPARWAPADARLHRVLDQSVGPREVLTQAESLLGGELETAR